MALKANTLLQEKALRKLKKENSSRKEMTLAQAAGFDAAVEEKIDQTNQFTLSIIFEDLCQKL